MKRTRILVIDDDPLFRSLIVSLLRKDFEVSVASEGADGFYTALEQQPDLVLIDLQMPGWDGLKTIKALRNCSTLSAVKIIILCSDANQESVVTGTDNGADDCVVKTRFSGRELQGKVARLTASGSMTPSRVEPHRAGGRRPTNDLAAALSGELRLHAPRCAALGPSEEDDLVQEMIDGWE